MATVAVDSNGDVVMTRSFTGSVDLGGGLPTSVGGQDIFAAKYSGASGGYLCSTSTGSTSLEEGYAIAINASNNVLLTGDFACTVNFGGQSLTSISSTYDIFLSRLSP